MKLRKQSLEKLSGIMNDSAPDNQGMFYRNLFATACYLSTIGELGASNKLLAGLFDQLGWNKRKTYFFEIKESMEEFAREYAREINANQEVKKLFAELI